MNSFKLISGGLLRSFSGSGGYQTMTFSLEWKMLHQVVNIFHLFGSLLLQKSSKILLCVSLEAEPDPDPRLHYCFLTSSLLLHPLPSLFKPALWNSEKVIEAEAYSLQTRNREHRKAFVSRSLSCIEPLYPTLLNFEEGKGMGQERE